MSVMLRACYISMTSMCLFHTKSMIIYYKNKHRQSQIALHFIYCVLADWLKETSYVIDCCAYAFVHYGYLEHCIYITVNWLTINLLVTCWSHSLHNLPIDTMLLYCWLRGAPVSIKVSWRPGTPHHYNKHIICLSRCY